ncbi:MAG TPA: hypothetical protein VL442_18550, partial [Mucilaginibacter sp.]|nr:hypothetical protein [Mucilaginibacter sp.]
LGFDQFRFKGELHELLFFDVALFTFIINKNIEHQESWCYQENKGCDYDKLSDVVVSHLLQINE